MSKKKPRTIKIDAKPPLPYFEYKKVSHPNVEDAIDIFEDLKGYRPQIILEYIPPSGKFQSWIIKEGIK